MMFSQVLYCLLRSLFSFFGVSYEKDFVHSMDVVNKQIMKMIDDRAKVGAGVWVFCFSFSSSLRGVYSGVGYVFFLISLPSLHGLRNHV